MSTPAIIYPGIGTGGRIAILTNAWGFIDKGLQALYMFDETTGTSFADKLGGPAAVITSDFTSNNAYSHLPGGGLQLEGAQILAGAAFDASQPFTLVTYFSIFDVTVEAAPRTYGLVGLRGFGAANGSVRGSGLYSTSASRTDGTAYFLEDVANGQGARAGSANVSGFVPTIGKYSMAVHSYNGVDTIRSSVYDKTGSLIGTASHTVTDAQLFTIGATTVVNVGPILGGFNTGFDNGKTRFEALARFNRSIDGFRAEEIRELIATGVALGASRGRPWA